MKHTINWNDVFLGIIIGFILCLVFTHYYQKTSNECYNSANPEKCIDIQLKD